MLKKAGAVVIAAAGLMLAGSPAFAAPSADVDGKADLVRDFGLFANQTPAHDQLGIANFGNDSDVLSSLSLLCNDDVNVLAVPVLQGNDHGQLCGNSLTEDLPVFVEYDDEDDD